MSIKPEYTNKIFSGVKKVEYRKKRFKKDIESIVVYSSAPVKKIVGEFLINDILYEPVEILWQKTKILAGISEECFFRYFDTCKNGVAIFIGSPILYLESIDIKKIYGIGPPNHLHTFNNNYI
jgi:predicted transcriptional regulator